MSFYDDEIFYTHSIFRIIKHSNLSQKILVRFFDFDRIDNRKKADLSQQTFLEKSRNNLFFIQKSIDCQGRFKVSIVKYRKAYLR
jgi:hypothetical protein